MKKIFFHHPPSTFSLSFLKPREHPHRCSGQLHEAFKTLPLSFSHSPHLSLCLALKFKNTCENGYWPLLQKQVQHKWKTGTAKVKYKMYYVYKYLYIYSYTYISPWLCPYLSLSIKAHCLAFEAAITLPGRKHPQSVSINRHANFSSHTHTFTTPSGDVCQTCQSHWSCLHTLLFSPFFGSPITLAIIGYYSAG